MVLGPNLATANCENTRLWRLIPVSLEGKQGLADRSIVDILTSAGGPPCRIEFLGPWCSKQICAITRIVHCLNRSGCQYISERDFAVGNTINLRRFAIGSLVCLTLLTGLCGMASSTHAQGAGNQPIPRQSYYLVFGQIYEGEFREAQANLRSLSRGAIQIVGGRFLDSVCYWTMLGESYYRLGEYSLAMEQFDAALDLYLNLQGWTTRTQIPPIAEDQGAARRSNVPWAPNDPSARYGAFNRRFLVRLGKTPAENDDALRRGGVIDPERLRSVDIAEAMRCVALACYRRYQINGPIGQLNPVTRTIATQMVGNGGSDVIGAWTGIPKALTLLSQGEINRAETILRSSLLIGGVNHPLTPLAYMGLGQIAIQKNQVDAAQELFIRASVVAAAFEQYDMVGESLRLASLMHSSKRTMLPYPPLLQAIEWAKRENRETLNAMLLTTAARLSAEGGDAQNAIAFLQRAKSEMARNDIRRSRTFTNWLYAAAMAAFVDGERKVGFARFEEFLKSAQNTSFWLYQIAAADNAVKEGVVTARESEVLYDLLLEEPAPADWTFRPEETMAFLATPHYAPMERWFEVALSRKAEEKAIGIAELVRRQRFFSVLPMGGRLLALRWVLNAPIEALGVKARKQKIDLLNRYPEYKALSDEAEAIRNQLALLPIAPEKEAAEFVQQRDLLSALGKIVGQQERTLRAIALLPDPCELAFPLPLTVPQIQLELKPGQVIVTFLQVGQNYYVMKLSNERYTIESQFSARVFNQQLRKLLNAISVGEKSAVYSPATFQNEDWRPIARELSEMIFAQTQPQAIDQLEEMVFVPDGKAWYLPMELLQVGAATESVNLNERVRVRYAPLAALGVPDQRQARRFQRSAIVASRNFLRDDKERIAAGLEDVQAALPKIETIDKTTQGPSALIAANLDQLVVWELSSEKVKDPVAFSPLQMDAGRSGGDLRSWMMLPWHGVDQLILSGVASGAEGSRNADGSELFLTTTGLMASGARTILISRWRVGGQSCLDLTRELLLDLGKEPASKAWARSLDLFTDSELDHSAEPRIQDKLIDQPIKASHPFFWAGYMLIDSGSEPVVDEVEAEAADEEDPGN